MSHFMCSPSSPLGTSSTTQSTRRMPSFRWLSMTLILTSLLPPLRAFSHVRPLLVSHPTLRCSSSLAATAANPSTKKNQNSPAMGGLRRLPIVKSPMELLDTARKEHSRVKADTSIPNARKRARKHGTERLNAVTEALCLPIRDVVNGYKREWRHLHPFERVVADLTVRARQKRDGLTLSDVLNDLHEARKMVLETGKEWMHKAKHADSARDANDAAGEGIAHLMHMYETHAVGPVEQLMDLQRGLKSAPGVQLDTPAVVLVGAPNVGKSSIVRYISSATPEVNNYPFTTRGMTLGHVQVYWDESHRVAGATVPKGHVKGRSSKVVPATGPYAYSQLCQIMDSPGLLARPDEKRNEMEELTLAAMRHLPTAVMYVMDLSGAAGEKCSSIADQLAIRKEIRERFPKRPWIDVVSKVDLGIAEGAEEALEEILGGAPYIRLSIHQGEGIRELRTQVLRMLGEVRLVLDAMGNGNAATTSTTNAPSDAKRP
eukprot:Nitzschia sp. Nitz4//scaffold76_size158648//14244//15796//NITZ4_002529-RA/size158648-augustus-gene-0.124-mRNA-1//1//CDS//3329557794//7213//frame0